MFFYAHLSRRKAQIECAKMVCLTFQSCDKTFSLQCYVLVKNAHTSDDTCGSTLHGSIQVKRFDILSETSACLLFSMYIGCSKNRSTLSELI